MQYVCVMHCKGIHTRITESVYLEAQCKPTRTQRTTKTAQVRLLGTSFRTSTWRKIRLSQTVAGRLEKMERFSNLDVQFCPQGFSHLVPIFWLDSRTIELFIELVQTSRLTTCGELSVSDKVGSSDLWIFLSYQKKQSWLIMHGAVRTKWIVRIIITLCMVVCTFIKLNIVASQLVELHPTLSMTLSFLQNPRTKFHT